VLNIKFVMPLLLLLSISSINAMEEEQQIFPASLMAQLDDWYVNKFIVSDPIRQSEKAFKAASFNSPKLYYLLSKNHKIAHLVRSDDGENLLSELLRHRPYITKVQAQFLLGCPFNLELELGANDSIFYRMIMFLQKHLMSELLQYANFKATQKKLETISWIIRKNPTIHPNTMLWWLNIKSTISQRLTQKN